MLTSLFSEESAAAANRECGRKAAPAAIRPERFRKSCRVRFLCGFMAVSALPEKPQSELADSGAIGLGSQRDLSERSAGERGARASIDFVVESVEGAGAEFHAQSLVDGYDLEGREVGAR